MYHDTIHINFQYHNYRDVNFDYSFLISKNFKDKFSLIKYGDLLQKFDDIGFDLKYLKFNDINKNDTVYCSYNYQPNFNIFFLAYKKNIENKEFNITFEYGNIIFGKFIPNNMNYFAGVHFITNLIDKTVYKEVVIKGKLHQKIAEVYQIIDKNGDIIMKEVSTCEKDFEQHFFDNYLVKVALRKYKLSKLKEKFK